MSNVFPTNLPSRLTKDGWWLAASSTTDAGTGNVKTPIEPTFDWQRLRRQGWVWIIPLIILADWLFWGHGAGISLALFSLAIVCSVAILRRDETSTALRLKALTLSALSVLPCIVATGFFPVIFAGVGTITASLMLFDRLSARLQQVLKTFAVFVFTGPFWIFRDALAVRKDVEADFPIKRILNGWTLPIGLGLIFLSLFAHANPFFEGALFAIIDFKWLKHIDIGRVCFWLGLGMMIWPFLNMKPGIRHQTSHKNTGREAPLWLAQNSIRNALLVFNVMFAAQTLLDLTYLWGGFALPDGMSYAEYAHRGAYPLLATALLAGVFMLSATIFEPLSAVNRKLLYLWIAQNAALLLSSILRLDLYVAYYSLTYLRVAAFIWMALVAVGLALIAIRIAQNRTNGWVLKRIAAVATVTVYLCCFVNFASLIANYNVAHSKEISGTGIALDRWYLCSLGPEAYPAADRFYEETGDFVEGFHKAGGKPGWLMDRFLRKNQNWREWGFRDALLSSYLATTYPKGAEARARYSNR